MSLSNSSLSRLRMWKRRRKDCKSPRWWWLQGSCIFKTQQDWYPRELTETRIACPGSTQQDWYPRELTETGTALPGSTQEDWYTRELTETRTACPRSTHQDWYKRELHAQGLHRFKLDKTPAPRRGGRHKVPTLAKKLFAVDSSWEGRVSLL